MGNFTQTFTTNFKWNIDVITRTRFSKEFQSLLLRIFLAIFIVGLIIIIQGTALWLASKGNNTIINSPGDGMYFIVVSTFGETHVSDSVFERVLMIIGLIEGLVLATYLIATTAFFTINGGRVMTRNHKDHIVICGWNFHGPRIIEELLNARTTQKYDIVVVVDDDSVKLNEFGSNVFVVRGPSTDDDVLIQSDIRDARSAIILTDTSLSPNNADSKVLMITLAVETLNPDVYTCAQIMNSENAIHLKRANVDELILFDVIGADLSVASALNPGVTKVVSELIQFDEGNELYRLSPPHHPEIINKDFKNASVWFLNNDMILIGVESKHLKNSSSQISKTAMSTFQSQKGLVVNPKNYILNDDDYLFVISEDTPKIDLGM